MEYTNSLIQARARQLTELTTELRLLARGTPIRIRTATGSMILGFLEMKRTRFLAEGPDGVCYSVPAAAFLGIAEGDVPKRFRHPRATRLLHHACEKNDLSEIERLISEGADINARSQESDGGRVPLEDAIEYGCLEAVRLLLRQGAGVNVRNRRGRTPLRLAAMMGYEDIVQELLANGADVNARDDYGTPEDWAARHHRTVVVEMLKRHQPAQNLNT